MNDEEIICMTCQDGTSDRWQCPECGRDIYEDRELRNRITDLESRLEESCAQNVADNHLIPALSQEVDDLKARNAELVEALKEIDGYISSGMDWNETASVKDVIRSAIRAGKDV